MMSNTTEHSSSEPSEQAIALFLHENDMDKLTDVLVDALNEALRIMDDETLPERLH
jgi:DNA-binding protein YbaB